MVRLGILVSHPIQYLSPWFRHLASKFDIQVFYAHRQDAKGQGKAGFGTDFEWDVPLLTGYAFRWLRNVSSSPSVQTFNGCDTPEIYEAIRHSGFNAFLIFGWNRKSALQAIWACWQNNVPVLMRGDSQLMTRRSPMKLAAKYLPYRWFLPRLDAHLYVGERNKAYLQHYGVPDDRLFFVPHFVNNSFFVEEAGKATNAGTAMAIRSRFGIPKDAFVFLFVGKMIVQKRPADFIKAFYRILASPGGSRCHALVVGDGPLRPYLEELTEKNRSHVHFSGFQNQSELPAIYRASDTSVLPSNGETWGLVVNEAFACGIPAVVSDAVGCAPDLIDEGQTGYTYPVGNIDALVERMVTLKNLCAERPTAVSKWLSKKVERYSLENATEGLKNALNSVLTRNA